MNTLPELGTLAIVTTQSGKRFVGEWCLATGIDYFWRAVIPGTAPNMLVDPDISWVVIGHSV